MADRKKRYFWLQLKEDFFDDDTMAYIEDQPNGKEYALIYLKMCLKSLKLDGYLKRVVGNTIIPYDIPTLAKLVNSNVDTVRVAMKMFEQIGLINILNSGEIYMNQIEEMIGSETEAAKQKRLERAKTENATLSQDSRKNVAQSKSNSKSLEIEKEQQPQTNYQKLVAVFEKNGFGTISPIASQKLNDELLDFTKENGNADESFNILSKAFEIAVVNGVSNLNYVLSITKRWYQSKLFTVSDIEASETKRNNKPNAEPKQDISKLSREEQLIAVMGKDGVRFD
ncbi:phage replisome organizer N-terminal domain-containing protein [Leuconostoc gasicomitatum]|uniref:phage replisome organizer N-terminal domain-containing protein n=1 Tax=Leuconostoc gasicomitatum TaxID=115778 RepID=UPI001CC706A4|nr:phage replisome organizer N-terminal domain-containing protein [Leuconostoc gasicomitatum]MBZ5980069.1 phage replisome organizer N-terminal domain-containing protein [Leuconostoc gasicomitatum]